MVVFDMVDHRSIEEINLLIQFIIERRYLFIKCYPYVPQINLLSHIYFSQGHDEWLDDHRKISIEEYSVQATNSHLRFCEQHEDKPYTMGCKVCHKLICTTCISNPGICSNGK